MSPRDPFQIFRCLPCVVTLTRHCIHSSLSQNSIRPCLIGSMLPYQRNFFIIFQKLLGACVTNVFSMQILAKNSSGVLPPDIPHDQIPSYGPPSCPCWTTPYHKSPMACMVSTSIHKPC
jgi:hypothetical protein